MNKRIKELASAATQYTNDTVLHLERVHNRDFSFDEIDEMYNTKFAELIVQDCINIANKYAAGGAGSDFDVGYISCATTLAEEFTKHFNNKQRSQDEDN